MILALSFTSAVAQQKITSGQYDMGKIGYDSLSQSTTVVIEQAMGGESGGSYRSCILYFEGKGLDLFYYEDYELKELKKHKAKLSPTKTGYLLTADYIPNIGICTEFVFTKNKQGKFECSLDLISKELYKQVSFVFTRSSFLYASNNQNSNVIKRLETYDVVNVVQTKGDWAKVKHKGKEGWIKSKDLLSSTFTPTPDPQVTITTPKSFFYQDASEAKPRKAFLLQGDTAFVEETKGDWLLLRYEGKATTRGWMHKKNVRELE